MLPLSGASPHTTELAGAYAHSVTMLSGQYGLYWHVQNDTLHLAMDVNTTGASRYSPPYRRRTLAVWP